jgi:hypothetical protein
MEIKIPPEVAKALMHEFDQYGVFLSFDGANKITKTILAAWPGMSQLAENDSARIAQLEAEVEQLLKSRNRWGQKYNKLLLKIRAGLGRQG